MSNAKKILGRLAGVKETKSGWSARCPAHDDGQASLSVGEGAEGRVLLRCHAGCSYKAIVEAIGLAERDLFDEATSGDVSPKAAAKKASTPKEEKKVAEVYASDREARAAYQRFYGRKFGQPASVHEYRDRDGTHVGSVIRWQPQGGKKEVRPTSRHADGWTREHMPEPRPLLGLPELLKSDGRQYVVEGEPCVDAAARIGLFATTSSGGSGAAEKTDWSPLAGRDVVILPDADAAGRKYAATVAEILLALDPPATVRIVDLAPDRDDGFDVADLVAACRSEEERVALRERIERQAAETEPLKAKAAAAEPPVARPTTAPADGYRSFPIDALPEPIAAFVRETVAAVDCDPATVGVPILPVLASAIGTTRRLALKGGNEVPAVLWAAVIAPVGSAKSTPFKAAVSPARARDRALRQENDDRRRDYETEVEIYETDVAAWRKARASGKAEEPPPLRPDRPATRRAVVQDITQEALAERLADNPRGLLMARDELSGWLGSFGRYAKGGPGGEEAFFLSCFDVEEHSVDRRTGDRREINNPTTALSIVGTIQPRVFRELVTAQRRASGLLARLFVTSPPGRPSRWTEAEVSFATRQAYEDVVASLYELKAEIDADERERPRIVRLSPEAKRLYVAWHDETADEITTIFSEDLAGAVSKLRGMAGRLALVLHLTKAAADRVVDPDIVDGDSMSRALRLAEWFKSEAARTYRLFAETAEQHEQRTGDERLLAWIRRQGAPVTAREALTRCRWLETAEEAEAALGRLATAGYGHWIDKPPGDRGGRPTRIFVLDDPPDPPSTASAQPAKLPRISGFANADDPPTLSGGVVEL